MRYRKQFLTILLICVFVALPILANAGDDEVEHKIKSNEAGRFKIFIAEHNIMIKSKVTTIKSIFKMDKDTGIVWRYRQGVDSKGKVYEEFFEVPNQ